MADARSTFLPRLHSLVQHSGDLSAYLTESGTYSPLTTWEQWHWGREVYKKKDLLWNIPTTPPNPYVP